MSGGDHGTHRHVHVTADTDTPRLTIALVLILALMAGEIVAGLLADSLVLLSDAAHMLTDAGAIALSLVALRLARRPAAGNLTYGLRRAEVLSAQANGATLLVLGALIAYEAVRRLVDPTSVDGGVVMAVAVVGAAVNLVVVGQLARANRENMAVGGGAAAGLGGCAARGRAGGRRRARHRPGARSRRTRRGRARPARVGDR